MSLEGLPSTSTIEGIDEALDQIISAIADEVLLPGARQSQIAVIRRKAIEDREILARLKVIEEQTTANRP